VGLYSIWVFLGGFLYNYIYLYNFGDWLFGGGFFYLGERVGGGFYLFWLM
jgi:hypothetical protein